MTTWLFRQMDRPRFVQTAFLFQVFLTTVFIFVALYANAQRISAEANQTRDAVRFSRTTSQENQAILREVTVTQELILCIVLIPPGEFNPDNVRACLSR